MIRKFLRKIGVHLFLRPRFKKIGQNVELPSSGCIDWPENITIDSDVYIGPEPYIFGRGGLHIGTNVIIGPRVTIHTTNHNYQSDKALPYDDKSFLCPVSIDKNVWIGSSVLICPGVHIGEGCVIAMGSVVTKSLPPGSIVGGNPAQILKQRDMIIYKKLDQDEQHYLKLKKRGKIQTKYLPRNDYK